MPRIRYPWRGQRRWLAILAVGGPTALAIIVPLILEEAATATTNIAGSVSVIDGDTLRLDGQRIRLFGIDAPESNQECTDPSGGRWRCGHHATVALERKIGWKAVTCEVRGGDRYGRAIAICEAGGEDLNAWMVRQGWAVAYTRYSLRYVPDELIARFADRGIWFGDFTTPEDWRRQHR